jgi:hypothetical protein
MKYPLTSFAKPVVAMALLISFVAAGVALWTKQDPGAPNTITRAYTGSPEISELRVDLPHAGNELRKPDDKDPRLTALDTKMVALQNELARLKRSQTATLKELRASVRAQGSPAEADQGQASPDAQETQAWAVVEAQEMRIEQAIETEEEDPEWAQGAVTSWTQVFQKEGIKEELKGVQLGYIECRTTLCRMELTPTDLAQGAAAFEQGFRMFMLFAPWQGPVFGKIENLDGQASVAVLYMAREGHALP